MREMWKKKQRRHEEKRKRPLQSNTGCGKKGRWSEWQIDKQTNKQTNRQTDKTNPYITSFHSNRWYVLLSLTITHFISLFYISSNLTTLNQQPVLLLKHNLPMRSRLGRSNTTPSNKVRCEHWTMNLRHCDWRCGSNYLPKNDIQTVITNSPTSCSNIVLLWICV